MYNKDNSSNILEYSKTMFTPVLWYIKITVINLESIFSNPTVVCSYV